MKGIMYFAFGIDNHDIKVQGILFYYLLCTNYETDHQGL